MSDLLSMAVCSRCLPESEPGAALIARLDAIAVAHGLSVQPTACLAGCDRPLTVGLSAPGSASYLFGDIDPTTDLPALLAFAALYRRAPGGWTNEGQRPEGLKGKIIARIPAPTLSERSA